MKTIQKIGLVILAAGFLGFLMYRVRHPRVLPVPFVPEGGGEVAGWTEDATLTNEWVYSPLEGTLTPLGSEAEPKKDIFREVSDAVFQTGVEVGFHCAVTGGTEEDSKMLIQWWKEGRSGDVGAWIRNHPISKPSSK